VKRVAAIAGAGAIVASCVPSLGPGDALIAAPRVLAIRNDPAEAAPGTLVTFTALVAAPGGSENDAGVAWSFCSAPKPLTEDNVVSDACLGTSSLAALGSGPSVTAAIPASACSIFGPDTVSTAFRPRDADITGGYYQPLRADLAGADTAFDLVRIHCDLANASAASATAFGAVYTLNQNPALLPLTATVAAAAGAVDLAAVPAGARLLLQASWDAASAETFAYYDPKSQTVTTQREAMQVGWYDSAGTLATESTGRAADDLATTSSVAWIAPASAGVVHLWIVLRDSRGGVDFTEVDVTVVE
jgi:hypothetical protein